MTRRSLAWQRLKEGGGVAKRVKSGRLKRSSGGGGGGALLQTLKTASGNLGYSVVIPIIHGVNKTHCLG